MPVLPWPSMAPTTRPTNLHRAAAPMNGEDRDAAAAEMPEFPAGFPVGRSRIPLALPICAADGPADLAPAGPSGRPRPENPVHGSHQPARRHDRFALASTPARSNTCRCFSMPRRPRSLSNSSRTPAGAARIGCISPLNPPIPVSGTDPRGSPSATTATASPTRRSCCPSASPVGTIRLRGANGPPAWDWRVSRGAAAPCPRVPKPRPRSPQPAGG